MEKKTIIIAFIAILNLSALFFFILVGNSETNLRSSTKRTASLTKINDPVTNRRSSMSLTSESVNLADLKKDLLSSLGYFINFKPSSYQ